MSLSEHRKEEAEKSRVTIFALVEKMTTLIQDSGATEEEAQAALQSVTHMISLMRLESSHARRYF